LSEDADVSLDIYDLFGHLVWTREFEAGAPGGMGRGSSSHPNSVEWSGVNDKGQKVGNGGYILIARAVAHGKVVMNSNRKIAVLR
jgi:flagellar hook assembly protein FlgD